MNYITIEIMGVNPLLVEVFKPSIDLFLFTVIYTFIYVFIWIVGSCLIYVLIALYVNKGNEYMNLEVK